jgi:hypothetical protein
LRFQADEIENEIYDKWAVLFLIDGEKSADVIDEVPVIRDRLKLLNVVLQ